MNVVSLLLGSILTLGINYLAVVILSVVNSLGSTHNGYVELSSASTNVVPVNEVNVSKLTAVKNAVLDGHGLASAEEAGTKVTVGVHRGEVAGLVNESTKLCVDRTGMTILMLLSKVGETISFDANNTKNIALVASAMYVYVLTEEPSLFNTIS